VEKVAVIIPAAGQGLRFGGKVPKQFVPIMGKPLIFWTIQAVLETALARCCVVVLPRENFDFYRNVVTSWLKELSAQLDAGNLLIVPGGAERQESVWQGLQSLPDFVEWVAIHDGARPLLTQALFFRVLQKAATVGAAIAATPARDTVKKVAKDSREKLITETVDRSTLWLAQTPQIFRRDVILKAYEQAFASNFVGTDDASLVERINHPVAVVEGDPLNIKITSKEDMEWLLWRLQKRIAP
jgi:2-C-methyl-D-erythritol 4-phosphate cytidylyltransferase